MRIFAIGLLVVWVCSACAGLQPASRADGEQAPNGPAEENNEIVDPGSDIADLSDYLRRIAGVSVQGSGANARVFVRGGATNISGGIQEPLYVIDGMPVQGGYSAIYSMLPIQEIARVRVLKGSDAALYGSRGGNGVIEITTK